ncbi:hypothetical protein PInf_018562 [Phytophthora infestans]|nr:hypothetical protein PInf_018562 [Phytophthora infestans]
MKLKTRILVEHRERPTRFRLSVMKRVVIPPVNIPKKLAVRRGSKDLVSGKRVPLTKAMWETQKRTYSKTHGLPPLTLIGSDAPTAVVARHFDALGALEHVERSISDFSDYSKFWTMTRAAAVGNIVLLRRLHAAGGNTKDTFSTRDVERAIELAATSGHLEVVQFLHSSYPQRGRTWCLELAASNGQLDVLKWLHEHGDGKDCLTMSAFDDAAKNGHLEVVRWMHENRSEGCTTRAMDCAARSGRFDILIWLHEHRQEGCTTQAMDWAARAGHLEVVQWLHLNRREGCSTMAIDAAASNGHLELVQWLHEHCSMTCSCFAHTVAAERGHHHVLEWIGQTEHNNDS